MKSNVEKLLNTFIKSATNLNFFGFGLDNESDTYPITNFKTLPTKISLKVFFNYFRYKILKFFYKMTSKKFQKNAKKFFRKEV